MTIPKWARKLIEYPAIAAFVIAAILSAMTFTHCDSASVMECVWTGATTLGK